MSTFPQNANEAVLAASRVGKKFCKTLKRSMYYGALDVARGLVGLRPDSSRLRRGEFWAVKDAGLELRKGDVLGIIGVNGSGKTTLLRLLAGIIPPDRGQIMTRGRVCALISLGAGFHPYMTGRENIVLNGTLLGMNRREIDSKAEAIIEFAGLGEFIDSPVSTYSAGMRVRLGFSVAMAVRPSVVLLDEVLAVGDRTFKARCYREIDRLSSEAAVILVSHQMRKIARVCNEVVIMDQGEIIHRTRDVPAGIDFYCSRFGAENGSVSGTGRGAIHGVTLRAIRGGCQAEEGDRLFAVGYGEDIEVGVRFSLDGNIELAVMDIAFCDGENHPASNCQSDLCGFEIARDASESEQGVRVLFPRLSLSPGLYSIAVTLREAGSQRVLVRHQAVRSFRVMGDFHVPSCFHLRAEWSLAESNRDKAVVVREERLKSNCER